MTIVRQSAGYHRSQWGEEFKMPDTILSITLVLM